MHKPFRKKIKLKILGIILVSSSLLVILIHLFFSGFPEKTKKINADILTVEGYLSTTALERVKDEFQNGGYDKLIITGLSYPGNYYQVSMDVKNKHINNPNSDAEDTRNELIRMNVNPSMVVAVPGEGNYINNTLKSALAFRDWLKASKYDVKGINIMSFGPHARRKYMIYSKILGKNYRVGIIYFPDYKNQDSLQNVLNELREFFGLVYYWVILRFY